MFFVVYKPYNKKRLLKHSEKEYFNSLTFDFSNSFKITHNSRKKQVHGVEGEKKSGKTRFPYPCKFSIFVRF